MKFRNLFVVLITISAIALAGCTAQAPQPNAPPTSQPSAPSFDVFAAETALAVYQAEVNSGKIKDSGEAAALQKAISDIINANPATPEYQTLVTAAVDALLGVTNKSSNAGVAYLKIKHSH